MLARCAPTASPTPSIAGTSPSASAVQEASLRIGELLIYLRDPRIADDTVRLMAQGRRHTAALPNLIGPTVLEIDGDNASGRSHAYGRAIFAGSEEHHRLMARYTDTCARRNGEWGFLHRKIDVFPPFPLPDAEA